MNQTIRTSRRGAPRARKLAVGTIAAGVAVVALAAPAFAHVDAEATGVTADGATEIVLSFEHGCEDEPTIEMKVQLPEGFSDAVPGTVEGFTGTVDGDVLVWSGGSIPDGVATEMPFTVKLAQPDGTEIPLPVIQQCPTKSNNWIEIAGESADDGDLGEDENSSPAPVITVPAGGGEQAAGDSSPSTTAADGASTTMAASPSASGEETPTPITTTSEEEKPDNSAGNAGLVVFLIVVAVIVGGAVLLYVRNRKTPPEA